MKKSRNLIFLSVLLVLLPIVLIIRETLISGTYKAGNIIGHVCLLLFGVYLLYYSLKKEEKDNE